MTRPPGAGGGVQLAGRHPAAAQIGRLGPRTVCRAGSSAENLGSVDGQTPVAGGGKVAAASLAMRLHHCINSHHCSTATSSLDKSKDQFRAQGRGNKTGGRGVGIASRVSENFSKVHWLSQKQKLGKGRGGKPILKLHNTPHDNASLYGLVYS